MVISKRTVRAFLASLIAIWLAASPSASAIEVITVPADNPPPLALENLSRVIITQVQATGGSSKTNEELIEIRNNSHLDVDITNWTIRKNNKTVVALKPSISGVGHSITLPSGAYAVFATPSFLGVHGIVVDGNFSNGSINNASDSLIIVDSKGAVISGLAWGSGAPNDGTPFPTQPASGEQIVLERKLLDTGWHQDTNSNFDDFSRSQLREIYLTGSIVEIFDACLNLPDVQLVAPDGWIRDQITGNCSDAPELITNECAGLVITEIAANTAKQFIEIQNSTDQPAELGGCKLLTNRSPVKYYEFTSEILESNEYYVVYTADTELTLTKTTTGYVELINEDKQTEVDKVDYANLSSNTSWSLIDGQWLQTFTLTPGKPNIYTKYLSCETGYLRNNETGRCNKVAVQSETKDCAANQFRNPATGRCKLIETASSKLTPCQPNQYRNPDTNRCRLIATAASALTPCKPGQYRNPETNRCRSLTTAGSTLVPCKPGQIRNPATNRCKAIASGASTLKPCQPGSERNPDTNRCRKIVSTLGVNDFPVEPIKDSAQAFTAWWALGGLLVAGAGYGTWEYRREFGRVFSSIRQQLMSRSK